MNYRLRREMRQDNVTTASPLSLMLYISPTSLKQVHKKRILMLSPVTGLPKLTPLSHCSLVNTESMLCVAGKKTSALLLCSIGQRATEQCKSWAWCHLTRGASFPEEPAEAYAASSMPSVNSSQNSTAPETSASLVHP